MNVCIAIPIHNESQEIGRLVEAIKTMAMDVVVIDDGSTDGCGMIAQSKGAVVLTNTCKQGKGTSLKRGFKYALQRGYDGVITMDGDGQHDAADLTIFLEQIARQPKSVVTGSRMGSCRGMPFIRFLTNYCMSGFISLLCRQRIPDTQCGFRYISCDILKELDLVSNDFEIETEVLIKASRLGHAIYSLPVKTIYNNEKSKIDPLKDTARFFIYILKEFRWKKPALRQR